MDGIVRGSYVAEVNSVEDDVFFGKIMAGGG